MSEKQSDVTIVIEQISRYEADADMKKTEAPKSNLIAFLQELKNALQVSHWNTTSYAEHLAFDKILDDVTDETDKFIESYQGRYGRISIPKSIDSHRVTGEYIETCIEDLNDLEKFGIKKSDTDLANIRDEVTGTLNKLKYLLSLK
ncbi:MAG: hypothetical protein D0530_04980 [Methylococcales bacterium]|nr:MAG: hypothetical protein D0530_04980 [Methylococcales bacterium]